MARTALTKAKQKAADLRSKYYSYRREVREKKVPNALWNTGGTLLGAGTVSVVRGLVPDEVEVAQQRYSIAWLKDGTGLLFGVVTGGIGVLTGVPFLIHMGGGATAVCGGALIEKGTAMARQRTAQWWQERQLAAPNNGAVAGSGGAVAGRIGS